MGIGIAIAVPYFQDKRTLRKQEVNDREALERLVAALHAEVDLAVTAANWKLGSIKETKAKLDAARAMGRPLTNDQRLPPGFYEVTRASVYKYTAGHIGMLPAVIVHATVAFYETCWDTVTILEQAKDFEAVHEHASSLMPRVGMHGALLLLMLDKLRARNFKIKSDDDVRPTQQEMKQAAQRTSYPFEEVARRAGLAV